AGTGAVVSAASRPAGGSRGRRRRSRRARVERDDAFGPPLRRGGRDVHARCQCAARAARALLLGRPDAPLRAAGGDPLWLSSASRSATPPRTTSVAVPAGRRRSPRSAALP